MRRRTARLWLVIVTGVLVGWSIGAAAWIDWRVTSSELLRAGFAVMPALVFPFSVVVYEFCRSMLKRSWGDVLLVLVVGGLVSHVLWYYSG